MVSFKAQRYYDRKEGATLETWFIANDSTSYREFDGIRIPGRSFSHAVSQPAFNTAY